jgi:hypothetical protein
MGVRARLSPSSSSGEAGSLNSNSGYDARVDSGMLEQFRQLGDVRRDAPRLVAGEHLRRRQRSALQLFLL